MYEGLVVEIIIVALKEEVSDVHVRQVFIDSTTSSSGKGFQPQLQTAKTVIANHLNISSPINKFSHTKTGAVNYYTVPVS